MSKKRSYIYVGYVFMIVFVMLFAVSCKKEVPEQEIETYDSSIDGIAVRPLPKMDIELANRIKQEGPVSPIADATDGSALTGVVIEPADSTTESSTPPVGTETAEEDYEDTYMEDSGSKDPNDYY